MAETERERRGGRGLEGMVEKGTTKSAVEGRVEEIGVRVKERVDLLR